MNSENKYLIAIDKARFLPPKDSQQYYVNYLQLELTRICNCGITILSPIIEPLETWEIGQLFGGN